MKNVGVFSKEYFLYKELEEALNDTDVILNLVSSESNIDINFDIFVILSDFGDGLVDYLKKFEGLVLDLTGIARNYSNNVEDILEPAVYIIEKYFGHSVENLKGNIYFPVSIYGKAGIDDLINQTKDIFTFGNSQPKILKDKMPFNCVLGLGAGESGIKNYIQRFSHEVATNFDLRLLPFSTYMIVDIFKPFNVEIYGDFLDETFSVSEVLLNDSHKLFLIDDERVTIVADYLRLLIEQVKEKINIL
ncbi:MAG: hypothetical protein JG767_1729 [Deferribacteraceae bacterium]|jgi:hypothetical protein|nr:hypothetical protein [Deferribacteraceae bacterium]